jgi:hypothetical protein
MAHREGLKVNHDRPRPPDLVAEGRSMPKIVSQV